MTTFLQFAVLGLGISAVYALLAHGLLVVHLGTGVLNFAHGGFAMFSAFLFYEFESVQGWPTAASFAAAVGVVTLIGIAWQLLVMRSLRNASGLAQVVATLGLLMLLQGFAVVKWGSVPRSADPYMPRGVLEVGGVYMPYDRLVLIGIAALLTLVLWAAFRLTTVGLAIRAGAENPRAASTLGWSADMLSTLTWGIGAMLAGLAGVLIAPLTGITVEELSMLILPVMAAALIANFASFPVVLLASLGIGIGQSEITQYVHVQGLGAALPFIVIIAILIIRGKGLPIRGTIQLERLPLIGDGRLRWWAIVPASVAVIVLIQAVFPVRLVDALTVSFSWSILMLSVIVLLGYTGQLSFEQMVMGGLAALVAGRLVADWNWSFAPALLVGVVVAVPIGLLFALPALRTRGVSLAVVTLGLAWTITQMVFVNRRFTGGLDGTEVGAQTLFGWSIDAVEFPRRYALLVFLAFVVCTVIVGNVRRGASGRRLIAVRTNERAAAALGVSVFGAKLFAFALAGALAGIGGIMLGFRSHTIIYSDFFPIQSVMAVGYSVIGGVGFIFGSHMGSHFAPGSIGAWIANELFPNANPSWLLVIGGVTVILMIRLHPDGIVSVMNHQARWVAARLPRGRRRVPCSDTAVDRADLSALRNTRTHEFVASDITVRFGGVTAVDNVSMEIRSGEVVGLIGPNGAGKTTLVDAVTGFVRPASGSCHLNGEPIDTWPVHRRARAGVSRSFQGLELFESSTVRENLMVASDHHRFSAYLYDLVGASESTISPQAVAAVEAFRLENVLETAVSDLPYGTRRLVAIARSIALGPAVLILDEPAAGLSGTEVDELSGVIRRLAAEWNLAIVVIEHDMSFVMQVCDRIVVLDAGRCIAAGRPEEIRSDPIVINAYLGEVAEEPSPAFRQQPAHAPS